MGYRATEKRPREALVRKLRAKNKNLTWLAARLGIHPNTLTRYLDTGFPIAYAQMVDHLLSDVD